MEVLSAPDAKEFLTEVARLNGRAVSQRTPAEVVPRPVRQLQNHLPKAEKERVAEAYRSGAPVKQIMAEFNIARTTVDRIARQHNIATRKVPALTDPQTEQAIRLYKAGDSLATVAKRIESSPNTVRAALLRLGVGLRPRSGSSTPPPLSRKHGVGTDGG
ncbi:hypothetical protein [Microbacterium sp.]|uniref:hypothetical protein n=1 Tax=Microbacterium sp. TaxID=51671 RepID=UPI001AD2BE43|nr:hypothetical protein [Microbacterium sp.]MBN9156901.1 hypothetical protein [Microbacterium sp.]